MGLWVGLLSGCGGGAAGPTTDSANGDVELPPPVFSLSEPIPLPGNHQRIPIRLPTDENPAPDSRDPNAGGPNSGRPSAADPASSPPSAGDREKPVLQTEFDPDNLAVKPGHWVALQSEGSTTEDNFSGDLKYSLRRGDARPRVVPGTRYYLRSQRPLTLAKDQAKRFETPLFMVETNQLTVLPELVTRGGDEIYIQPHRMPDLLPHQYHVVVLSDQPDRYNFLKRLPSIRNMKLDAMMGDWLEQTSDGLLDQSYSAAYRSKSDAMYYKLTLSRWDSSVELPANMQQWTSIAYLVWGDFDPERLTPEQQTAVVDWLHFGGQLIVGGEALELLSQSFLQRYLPVEPTGSVNEPYDSLRPLLEHWSLHKDASGQPVLPPTDNAETFVRTQWKLASHGGEVPHSAGLVAESQVGKGRIVTTAFSLSLPRLRGWTSLDHWFNGCLLRRPGRVHQSDDEIMQGVAAQDPLSGLPQDTTTSTEVSGFQWQLPWLTSFQPSVFTSLDLASRDWLHSPTEPVNTFDPDTETWAEVSILPVVDAERRRFASGSKERSQAAWNDYSEIAQAARASLKDQAGITPPSREWVLQALILYLVILVPVNYAIFRLLRRLEWAWFSIPVIAVTGAFVVVRAASLDIGFSNKQLQIQLLEIPTDYERGHLTGYGSLYSSLTTRFRFLSDNPTTLALPFPSANFPTETNETPVEFSLEPGRPVRFGPQEIVSNTMEMYQFQQVVELGGRLEFRSVGSGNPALAEDRLRNGTRLSLADVGIFRWDEARGHLLYGQLPRLAAGDEATIKWQRLPPADDWLSQWQGTCLEDYAATAERWARVVSASGTDPYERPWVQALDRLRAVNPEWAAALEQAGQRRRLPDDALLTRALLLAAVRESAPEGLGLGQLFRAVLRQPLGPNEVRLVAWTDDAAHQWEIQPLASQSDHRSLVLAHLRAPQLPPLGYDQNLAYLPTKPTSDTDVEGEATDDAGDDAADVGDGVGTAVDGGAGTGVGGGARVSVNQAAPVLPYEVP